MPWKEVSTMSLREEFVVLASREAANTSALCRRFRISRKTAYKWLSRYRESGAAGLSERLRRPHTSPNCTPVSVQQTVLALRDEHPAWGGRKLKRYLEDHGHEGLPSPGTLTAVLRRHNRLNPAGSANPSAPLRTGHKTWQRFEHDAPDRLWQMDFKGHFATDNGRCQPLTVLDDHSRFALCLHACADQRGDTVQARLTEVLRRYGLPERMTMDNGSPWGADAAHPYTALTVWLLRLGIRVSHARPYHPQTQGKDERFHRTLVGERSRTVKVEVLKGQVFRDRNHCQRRFDQWRDVYNLKRPHDALGLNTPASRYRESDRPFPETLPAIEYAPGDVVRQVQSQGLIHYRGQCLKVSKAFHGYPVALRPTATDGLLTVYFCQARIAHINLNA